MSETSFTILNYSQSVKIADNEIWADHDTLNAYLYVPISFIFRTLNDDNGFDILPINARLSFLNPQQLLSDHIGQRGLSFLIRESNPGYILKFQLNKASLHFIEKNRKGDLNMSLELDINAYIKSSIQKVTGRRSFSNDYIQNELVNININIPRSVWVEKILPKTGFCNLRLIEIPLSHKHLREAYKDIIFEFDKAEQYFNLHDYNKCVAHCRHTLDDLTRNLTKIKKEVPSETGFEWLRTISGETFKWVDKMNQKSSAITSKSHHSGQTLDFTRHEAESIYLVVLGLLNYIGNLAT